MSKPRHLRIAARVKRQQPAFDEQATDYWDDRDEPFEPEWERCHGDGMDPWNDYMLPCPLCQGEQMAHMHQQPKEDHERTHQA